MNHNEVVCSSCMQHHLASYSLCIFLVFPSPYLLHLSYHHFRLRNGKLQVFGLSRCSRCTLWLHTLQSGGWSVGRFDVSTHDGFFSDGEAGAVAIVARGLCTFAQKAGDLVEKIRLRWSLSRELYIYNIQNSRWFMIHHYCTFLGWSMTFWKMKSLAR